MYNSIIFKVLAVRPKSGINVIEVIFVTSRTREYPCGAGATDRRQLIKMRYWGNENFMERMFTMPLPVLWTKYNS